MESAIIFGKNRHLYGGLEPSNMVSFNVNESAGVLKISCQLPEDTYIDGQLLCTVAGAVIRSKTDGYPKDEFDGDLVSDVTASCVFEDPFNSTDSIVYYAAFPYSDQVVYNRSELNRTLYDPDNAGYIFGYDLDTTEPDPDKRVTYPSGVTNVNYSPAKMNYSTGVFDYGGWSGVTPGVAFMPKPCMLKNNGTVDYYLNPNDYTKKEDGTASDVANVDYQGNAMIEWPKIYTKRWEENGIYHFRCSAVKQDDSWDCWCNYDKDNNEIDHFYTAIYLSSNVQSVTRSMSGRTEDESNRTYAKKNGSGWDIEVLADRLLIQDLLVMLAKTTDCQTAYGDGDWNGGSNISGSMDTKGMFWGSNSDGTAGVKVFGMENWWGDTGRSILGWGINAKNGRQYIKITSGTHDGTTIADYSYIDSVNYFDSTGYIEIAKVGSLSDYITGMLTTDFGRFPIAGGGSSSSHECDVFYDAVANRHSDGTLPVQVGVDTSKSQYTIGPFAGLVPWTAGECPTALSCKPSVS